MFGERSLFNQIPNHELMPPGLDGSRKKIYRQGGPKIRVDAAENELLKFWIIDYSDHMLR